MEQSSKPTPSIAVKDLSKKYKGNDRLALDKLNLSVYPGEIYGFLGPNGAGKSTTIRLLMNFIQPTGGQASILGLDVVRDSVAIRRQVGYLSGDFAMYPKMTGQQFLQYMSDLWSDNNKAYVKELAKRLNADLNKKLGDLSRGNFQKIAIIQAFMNKPAVLILDEPSSGLDPLMQEEFYALLREAKARDSTIFMSSHILGEVQKVCDRVGIIRDGRLIAEKSIAKMTAETAQTFEIVFAGKPPSAEIKKLPGVKKVSINDETVTLHMHGDLSPLFGLLAKHKVTKFDAQKLSLEELFLHYYERTETKS